MSSETTYSVEIAKSGRSKCKKCKTPITKGTIRIAVESPGAEFSTHFYYLPACFTIPRKLKDMTATDFIDNVLVDASGGEILPAQAEILAAAIASSPPKSATKTDAKSSKDDILSDVKAAFTKQTDDDEHPVAKKPKNDLSRAVALYGKYHKQTADQLKDFLRYNKQVLGGTKSFVLFKVIDGEEHGRLGPCTLCQGRLKFDVAEESKTVVCSGQFDEATQTRIPCSFSTTQKDAPRLSPWYVFVLTRAMWHLHDFTFRYTEPPTEEEKKEMERLLKGEDAASGAGGDTVDNEALLELTEKAKALDWDLSNKQGLRQAAAELLAVLKGSKRKIDLPEDNKKAMKKVGETVMINKDKSAPKVLETLVQEFGFTEQKEKQAAKKMAAQTSAVAVPENAALVAAFTELSSLYFKEGNRNAGGTYNKVVKILSELDFEITTANAPGLSKGKTKLPGIGKSSGDKIVEFLKTGTMAKLEEKRADLA